MVVWLKDWIINICTAVFFIMAVEMILPNNGLKRYAKFVLGLILIVVVINPMLRLYNENLNVTSIIGQATSYMDGKKYDSNIDKYRDKNIETTLNTFKANLENNCEKFLKEKFPNYNCKVGIEVQFDRESGNVTIASVKVGIKDSGIEKVKKVEIKSKGSLADNNNILKDERSSLIINSLSTELNVSKELITVYKM